MTGSLHVTRTNIAVGGLLAAIDAMPHERFIELRKALLGTKSPETHPDLVPVFKAVGELMEAYESDALADLAGAG